MTRISEVHTDQRQAGLEHKMPPEPGLPLADMDTVCSTLHPARDGTTGWHGFSIVADRPAK